MEDVAFYQTVKDLHPTFEMKHSKEPDTPAFVVITLHSMFKFIRSNQLKKTFSEIACQVATSRSNNDQEKTLLTISNILSCVKTPLTTEAKCFCSLYEKVPSKEYVELIWSMRESLIQLLKKDSFYFKSFENHSLHNAQVLTIYKTVANLKEIKLSNLEKELEQHLDTDNSKTTMEVSMLILLVCKEFARFNCYALRSPGKYVPQHRSVNAYVYSCFT